MQSNESSAKKLHMQKCLSFTHGGTALVSGIAENLTVTKDPEAEILNYNLEIPPQAQVMSVPLSCFSPIMQQLISTRIKHVSKVREATEIPTVTYIWPVLKVGEAYKHSWDRLPNSFVPNSPNLARHCSGPDVVSEDVTCSQVTPVKQLAQEEQDSKMTKSYPLILKSSNAVVSGILRSLANTKDYKNILPLSSISPIGKKVKIPFKENAMIIYNGEVYIPYIMRCETLSTEMETHNQHTLLRKATVSFITCRTIRERTGQLLKKAAIPSKELQNRNEREAQQKVDKELRKEFGVVKDMRIHLERINPSELKEDFDEASTFEWKFPKKAAFPFEESQRRIERVAQQKENSELRRKFGIVKDIRIHLERLTFP
ncbi:ligand-dependent nuclear receptor-interacting factor 1-like [Excalfactoria chinensis]|uniref:ligand-dependent nuclear receptor-interacting factor 1-like n=1 Tax=Excalfactoria chinensis TaxID=46218 RepID=UPI003B3ABC54